SWSSPCWTTRHRLGERRARGGGPEDGGTAVLNINPVVLAVVGIVVLILIVAMIVTGRYKVSGPNEAFIVTGRKGRKVVDPKTGAVSHDVSGQKVVVGGGVFVLPFVQRLHVLDLSSRRIPLRITGAVSGHGVKINLDGVAIVKVGGN